ncbi:hypothetical protein C8J57DRAFT_1722457 [Mycena rebaudengoi]|nr:hypothetical protein C8J57DRAFT_1722457 [Mycena rebaudengoi]
MAADIFAVSFSPLSIYIRQLPPKGKTNGQPPLHFAPFHHHLRQCSSQNHYNGADLHYNHSQRYPSCPPRFRSVRMDDAHRFLCYFCCRVCWLPDFFQAIDLLESREYRRRRDCRRPDAVLADQELHCPEYRPCPLPPEYGPLKYYSPLCVISGLFALFSTHLLRGRTRAQAPPLSVHPPTSVAAPPSHKRGAARRKRASPRKTPVQAADVRRRAPGKRKRGRSEG